MNRRQFLRAGAGALAALAVRRKAYGWTQSPTLSKFGPGQALPALGSSIPVATPQVYPTYDFYNITMRSYSTHSFHPALGPARLWGYADATNGAPINRYLGPVIVCKKGRPVRVRYKNELKAPHPLPVDTTLMGAEQGAKDTRAVVHLHGGHVDWTSDGGPYAWFDPAGNHGPSYVGTDSWYPNDQSARLMWYHDHALGTTRLNAYAGLASAYILRDELEDQMIQSGLLPSGANEIPLIIQDKTFQANGQLWYPSVYDPGKWDAGPGFPPPAGPSVVPEFFADTAVINGMAYPYLDVKQERYRFRILNASNGRFYNLQLYYESAAAGEANLKKPGPPMVQVATEGGFLPMPVVLNDPPQQIAFDTNPASPTYGNATRYTLLLAPAERADIVIDFSGVPAGSRLILYNDAPAPFPMGDEDNDYSTEDGMAMPGAGPNTRTLMQFRVVTGGAPATNTQWIQKIIPLLAANTRTVPVMPGTLVRDLTLNEDFDQYGRLIQRLGTDVQNGFNSQGLPTWARDYMDMPTEMPKAGSTEVWRIINLTGDTHPIHFHLSNAELIGRQPFDAESFNGKPRFTGPSRKPDPNERGLKDTIRMNPNEVTTVAIQFALPQAPFAVPFSPRLQAMGMNAYEYVWHCHILDHEEHDMMRPLAVMP